MTSKCAWSRVLLCVSAALSACSADAVQEPPLDLRTPGVFVAQTRDSGGYRLLRTRTALAIDADRTLIFFDEHLPGADTLSQAKTKAQDPALELLFIEPLVLSQFAKTPYQVIWYRSMTDEERNAHGGL